MLPLSAVSHLKMRESAALGRMGEAHSYDTRVLNAAKAISRDQDRTLFQSDLDGGPWFGLDPKRMPSLTIWLASPRHLRYKEIPWESI